MHSTTRPPRSRGILTVTAATAVIVTALALLVAAPAQARRPTRGTVSWGDTSLTSSDGAYAVTGRVTGGRGRAVRLEVRWDDGWHAIDRARTLSRGRFRIAGTFEWYGAHPVRVAVAPTRRLEGKVFGPRTFSVQRLWTGRGERSAQEFFRYPYNGRNLAFAWNPCRTITYRVNPGYAGDRAIALTKEAVRRVAGATGFRFRYVGTTTKVPIRGPRYPRGTEMIVAWSHEEADPGLAGAVGVGGFRTGYLARRTASGRKVWQIHRPGVTMNMAYGPTYPWAFTDPDTEPMGLVLIHELGHSMGLAHYPDDIQIMHPGDRSARPTGYAAVWETGDLAGLRKVGAQPGCLRLVRGRGDLSAPGQLLD